MAYALGLTNDNWNPVTARGAHLVHSIYVWQNTQYLIPTGQDR